MESNSNEAVDLKELDSKDYKILRELDSDFRQSFSKIGKNVGLSKNSVALRFEKLKKFMLHNMTGLNNEVIGYTHIKVYYSFDFYDEHVEKMIIDEIKKNKNIRWVEKFYGTYDISLCLMVKNIDEMISQINSFDLKFAHKINKKEIQIFNEQNYFRYNFLHEKPLNWVSKIKYDEKEVEITKLDKRILHQMLYNPRANVIDVAKALGVSYKTVSKRLRALESSGVIMGYFMTLDAKRFGYNTFKILVQVHNPKQAKELEDYLFSLKNVKYFAKMIGAWDYEIDFIYPNMTDLQNQLEYIKQKFPNMIRKIEIESLMKRIVTNKKDFFEN